MVKRFKRDGYSSSHLNSYNYNSVRGVIYGANVLNGKVNDTLNRTGKSKVDLVAHSMGGLVIRYYMKHLGGASKVDDVVYIATPHNGTDWAYIERFTTAAADMRPNSSVLQSIDGYTPGFSIWSKCDEIVIPHSSANVGNSWGAGCWGHLSITYSYNVYKKTRDYVR